MGNTFEIFRGNWSFGLFFQIFQIFKFFKLFLIFGTFFVFFVFQKFDTINFLGAKMENPVESIDLILIKAIYLHIFGCLPRGAGARNVRYVERKISDKGLNPEKVLHEMIKHSNFSKCLHFENPSTDTDNDTITKEIGTKPATDEELEKAVLEQSDKLYEVADRFSKEQMEDGYDYDFFDDATNYEMDAEQFQVATMKKEIESLTAVIEEKEVAINCLKKAFCTLHKEHEDIVCKMLSYEYEQRQKFFEKVLDIGVSAEEKENVKKRRLE